jgi:hypothetical protein
MVINYLDIVSVAPVPTETESPLIIDPNAVLALARAAQFFEPIARRNPQVLDRSGIVQHDELTTSGLFDSAKTCGTSPIEERLGVLASKRSDHANAVVLHLTSYVK